ncbi:MAG: adenylate/guanylate cyclase domain-containing protein [Gammaproteobacteria bacterium]
MLTPVHDRPEAERSQIDACLAKILASPQFAQSERQRRFLRYIVTEALAGRTDRLKGYSIGVEVFDRDRDFDPAVDAIVRVEAARLRAKLREYYEGAGRGDPVRFDLPKGAYTPEFQRNAAPASAAAERQAAAADAQRPAPVEDKPSIAVLPFANMSADPEQGYFADGFTDGLITELSRLSSLFVISRQSSFAYKGLPKRAEEIGTELGVRYLLEGGVQRAGDRVRITAQLIDSASDAHLWAERYDRELKDIFAVQDDVARRIVAALRVKLAGGEAERVGHADTASTEAHDAMLRGLERYWVYTQASVAEARELFAQAVELDPRYAFAHAWLARTLTYQWISFWDPRAETLERAFEHARTAVDLDPRMPYAHSVLGWVQLWRMQEEAAISAGRRAVALDPNNADAHLFLTMTLAAAARGEEALPYIQKAMRLNPHPSAFYQVALGMCHYAGEDYGQAIAAFRRGTELSEVFVPNHFFLCIIYTLLNRDEEARAEREKILAITGGRTPVLQKIWLDEDLRLQWTGLLQLAGLG